MDANPVATRSILSSIAADFVFRIVDPLERFFSGHISLQQRRGNLIRAYARKHSVYLVPEILDQPEQCPCSQHTTSMLVHSAKRSYCFDCWNERREEHLIQTTFHLKLSSREWRLLHDIFRITSANLRRVLDGQPAEHFELNDFDLFVHLCEGVTEAWGAPEKAFQSLASLPRDVEHIAVDLDPREISLVKMSLVAVAEMWKASLEPSVLREFPYEVIPTAEWSAFVQAIDSLVDELTRNSLFE